MLVGKRFKSYVFSENEVNILLFRTEDDPLQSEVILQNNAIHIIYQVVMTDLGHGTLPTLLSLIAPYFIHDMDNGYASRLLLRSHGKGMK